MKHMKKLLGLLLAVVMTLAMSVSVFAANVTVEGSDGILKNHTFKAYQIVKGNVVEGALSNPTWGNGIDSDSFINALKNVNVTKFSGVNSVETFVKVLSDNNTDENLAKEVARIAYANKLGDGIAITEGENAGLAEGYYLIVDTTENLEAGSAYNTALLQVVGDVKIKVKTDAPEVEKKVKENKKYSDDAQSTQGYHYGQGYNDVADYNIGDEVPFSFYSKAPDMSAFSTYEYIFHDTMSKGLTLKEDSITVTIKTQNADSSITLDSGNYTVSKKTGDNSTEFSVKISNLKNYAEAGDVVRVDFNAELNVNAKIGLPGNPNEVYLEYSSNPNDTNGTNRTPIDRVIVFTYELDTTKIDGATSGENLKTLSGAKFKLRNKDGEWVKVDDQQKVSGWTTNEAEASELESDAQGLFKVIGLDAGKYYLKETAAPRGYNTLKDEIEVELTAETTNGQSWDTTKSPENALTAISVTADHENGSGNVSNGVANITVANNKGGTLPSTGGIGTTIFYVIGGILMAGAAILLITKKKMSDK